MKLNRHYALAAVILMAIVISLVIVHLTGSPYALSFCTPTAGVITFFSFLTERTRDGNASNADERLRHAIAAAIVVQYLVLVGIVSYFVNSSMEKLPAITETMLSSFTTVTSVVVAFYFGASVFSAAKNKSKVDNESEK